MADSDSDNTRDIHDLKNHLAIVMGFCDLLLSEMPADDRHRKDVEQINRSARDALTVFERIVQQFKPTDRLPDGPAP